MTGERSRSLFMNFGSLTRNFLLVKTSLPMGFAVGTNFENFMQRKVVACKWNKIQRLGCFRIKKRFGSWSVLRRTHGDMRRSNFILVLVPMLKTCEQAVATQPGTTFVPWDEIFVWFH